MTDERLAIFAAVVVFLAIPAAIGAFSTSRLWQDISHDTFQAYMRAQEMFDPISKER